MGSAGVAAIDGVGEAGDDAPRGEGEEEEPKEPGLVS